MKQLITEYTFDASARQITFLNMETLLLEQVLLITNVTDGIVIYSFADPSMSGSVAGNILTLLYNTSTMDDSDSLQIYIDTMDTQLPVGASTEEMQEQEIILLRQLLKNTFYARDISDRMRVILDNNPMLYTYMRNSGTPMAASTEGWYSLGSWNVVDAREPLSAIQNTNVMAAMQKWRIQ